MDKIPQFPSLLVFDITSEILDKKIRYEQWVKVSETNKFQAKNVENLLKRTNTLRESLQDLRMTRGDHEFLYSLFDMSLREVQEVFEEVQKRYRPMIQ
jgi:hypothetical protein